MSLTAACAEVATVVFDLDNTLVNRQRAFARWAVAAARRWRPDWRKPQRKEFCRAAVACDDWGAADRLEMAAALAGLLDADRTPQQMWHDFRGEIARHVRTDRSVLALLERLRRRGFKLAVASNGSLANQQAKLTAGGLDEIDWELTAISGEWDAAKPSPRFYELIRRRLGVPARQLLMVGDDALRDVAAAHAAGWRTCWVSWGRAIPDVRADFVVEHLTQLEQVLP